MAAGRNSQARGWVLTQRGAEYARGEQLVVLPAAQGSNGLAELDSVSALTLDTLILALDHLQQRPAGACITPRSLLTIKGSARRGAEGLASIKRVAGEFEFLQRLAIQTRSGLQPIFLVEPGFLNVPGSTSEEAFYFRAGSALRSELKRSPWAPMPLSVLALDHRAVRGPDVLAKKLAVVIISAPTVTVARELLSRAGELPIDARAGRVVERFEAALPRLEEACAIVVQQPSSYIRRKGAIHRWLDAPLAVSVPSW